MGFLRGTQHRVDCVYTQVHGFANPKEDEVEKI